MTRGFEFLDLKKKIFMGDDNCHCPKECDKGAAEWRMFLARSRLYKMFFLQIHMCDQIDGISRLEV